MKLHFMGGADTVTGSQHIVEAGGRKTLRDCGMFQGRRSEAREINATLPFDPASLQSVVLSHAHIDHCGNLPTLAAKGYAGRIHATTATASLTDIMLHDAAHIQEQDAAYMNQKSNRKELEPISPLYTTADAEAALQLLQGHEYHQPFEVAPGIVTEFLDAGHILGSALSTYDVEENGRRVRVGFAVDLGRKGLALIRDPEVMENVDVLVMESTYGDRLHDDSAQAEEQLYGVIHRTFARGGRVFIPAFALERTQEILFHVARLMVQGRIPRCSVVVDSPMAASITRVFAKFFHYLDEEMHKFRSDMGGLDKFQWVRLVSSVEESKAITKNGSACIVIAASGMCEHGRILHHLKQGITDPRNTVAMVGYQAENTLGRKLLDGVDEVRIFGDTFPRKAEIAPLHAFSAHADRNELIDYVRQIRPKSTYLVHGEQKQREALAQALRDEKLTEVFLPKRGDVVEL